MRRVLASTTAISPVLSPLPTLQSLTSSGRLVSRALSSPALRIVATQAAAARALHATASTAIETPSPASNVSDVSPGESPEQATAALQHVPSTDDLLQHALFRTPPSFTVSRKQLEASVIAEHQRVAQQEAAKREAEAQRLLEEQQREQLQRERELEEQRQRQVVIAAEEAALAAAAQLQQQRELQEQEEEAQRQAQLALLHRQQQMLQQQQSKPHQRPAKAVLSLPKPLAVTEAMPFGTAMSSEKTHSVSAPSLHSLQQQQAEPELPSPATPPSAEVAVEDQPMMQRSVSFVLPSGNRFGALTPVLERSISIASSPSLSARDSNDSRSSAGHSGNSLSGSHSHRGFGSGNTDH